MTLVPTPVPHICRESPESSSQWENLPRLRTGSLSEPRDTVSVRKAVLVTVEVVAQRVGPGELSPRWHRR